MLTQLQREVLLAVARNCRAGFWYRAQSSGQRVTLASLHRKGLLTRRVRRKGANSADNAYEYRLSEAVRAEFCKS